MNQRALLAALLLALGFFAHPLSSPPRPNERVVVLPFANQTGEKSLYWMGEAFAIGVTDHLLAGGFRVVDADRRRQAVMEMGLDNDAPISHASTILLARQLNAPLALIGEIHLPRDHFLAITGQLIRINERRIDKPVILRGAINDLYSLQRDLASALVPGLGLRAPHTLVSPLEALQRVPLSIFELYIKGVTAAEPEQRRIYLDRALDKDPLYPAALLARARVSLDEGQSQKAMEWLDRVQVDRMAFPERLWLVRGETVAANGDRGSAVDLYRKVLEARPLPAAHFHLAAILAQQGKLMQARREVEAGLADDPRSPTGIELREALARREESPS
ncbi:MAG: tetratricopeptide repeat protein [Acidobacteriota bacterium]